MSMRAKASSSTDGVDPYRDLRMDMSTHSLQVINYAHHEIHSGSSYTVSKAFTVPAGTKVNLGIITPNTAKWAHMTFDITCDAAYTANFYEGDDYSGGTAVTAVNRNRNSTNTAGVAITHTDTDQGAGTGTLLWTFSGGANKAVTTAGSDRHEFILKQNTSYLIEVVASLNDIAHIELDWYEHEDKS